MMAVRRTVWRILASMDPKLAETVALFLEALEERGSIERCNHRGCERLASGEPDFGPHVDVPVCESHVPKRAVLIGGLDEFSEALRAVLAELNRYEYRFDLETGKRLPLNPVPQ